VSTEGVYSRDIGRGNSREKGGGEREARRVPDALPSTMLARARAGSVEIDHHHQAVAPISLIFIYLFIYFSGRSRSRSRTSRT